MLSGEQLQLIKDFERGIELMNERGWVQGRHDLYYREGEDICVCATGVWGLGMGFEPAKYNAGFMDASYDPTWGLIDDMGHFRNAMRDWYVEQKDFRFSLPGQEHQPVHISRAVVWLNDHGKYDLQQILSWLKSRT